MSRSLMVSCVALLLLAALVGTTLAKPAPSSEASLQIAVQVSPQTLILRSEGEWVTVHTNIPLGQVDRETVSLNGVSAARTKADARGNLVAKFTQTDIEAIVEPPEATLVLTGLKTDGTPFWGSDTIRVVEPQ